MSTQLHTLFPNRAAASHEGRYGVGEIFWHSDRNSPRDNGWYAHRWDSDDDEPLGPFKTSLEAWQAWSQRACPTGRGSEGRNRLAREPLT